MSKIKKPSKKLVVIILLAVLLVIGGYFFHQKSDSSKMQEQTDTNKVNLKPPTKEDNERADANKQRNVDRQQQENTQANQQSSSKKSIKPTITYAGQYDASVEVGAFVSGVFEDSGTCTATFTRGGSTINKSVQAVRGSNSMSCPVMSASASEFAAKGSWSVTVSYNSTSSQGSSDVRQIEVK